MKALKLISGAVLATILVVGVAVALPPQARTQPTSASESAPFDHSNCQYPTRWSNPPDGCDNSDPAVPECVGKGSTEAEERACIDAFVKAHQDPQPTPTVTTTAPPKVSECVGK